MHKNEFIRQLARETSLPQKEVNQVIKCSIDLIARTLREGDKVVLTGFGTFEMRTRRERRGVNPQTKDGIIIPATQTPGFTASNSLKLAVVGNKIELPDGIVVEESTGEILSSNGESAPTPKSRGRKKAKAQT